MTLAAGARLGPYEILSAVGAGGMGEVYRARDTRLERTVAVKVLPAKFSENAEFRQRFEREAKTISQLSHPHICTLHDVGNHDGVEYLVMEFLEGKTLTECLAKGPLPLEQVLRYGIEIADALEKAHRQGVVHRDLKPGNVMITKSGVKLVDFGLAKLAQPTAPGGLVSSFSILPTQAGENLTAQGTILGTFQYMAPEQLEGHETDARADIFALGLVLYEMATGNKAFTGRSQASLIGSILKDDPPPISAVQPMTPPALDRVVKTCLAKDPDDRFQTAHDVKLQLQWIAEGGSAAGVAAPVAARRKSREKLAWVLFATAALAAAGLAAFLLARWPEPPRTVHSTLLPPGKSTFALDAGPMALSPDGRRIAFIANSSGVNMLWVRQLSGLSAQALAGTEGASYPFWSPDSRFLGFFANGKLRKIEASGGPPQTLTDATLGRGGAWNREGVILFSPSSRDSIHRVSASGGDSSPVTKLDLEAMEFSHRWPHFLPDGRRFLYLAQRSMGGTEKNGIYVASLDDGERVLLFNGNTNVVYASPGYLLYHRERTLLARPFDPKSLRFSEEAFPVAEDVQFFANFAYAVFSTSHQGLLAYQAGSGGGQSQLTWFERTGKAAGAVGAVGHLITPRLSNDGRRVAVGILDAQAGLGDIWIHDLSRNTPTRFTFDPAGENSPLWSPDDSRIVFSSTRKGAGDLYVKDSAGTANEEPLVVSSALKIPLDWSRDGRTILYQENDPRAKTLWDLWTYSIEDRKTRPFLQTTFNEVLGKFSPDGRWIAYASNESGREEVYVVAFPGPGGKWQISTAGGRAPIWTKGGREIVYQSPANEILSVEVGTEPTFQAGIPKALFKTHLRPPPGRHFDVTPDGERFLVNLAPGDAVSDPVTLVQNWAAERKR